MNLQEINSFKNLENLQQIKEWLDKFGWLKTNKWPDQYAANVKDENGKSLKDLFFEIFAD